jgi:CDP-diacylglycerol--glycerol-3-phosphate 3-phosphatidyltransferase
MTIKDLPNLLTGARIVFSVAVFIGIAAAAGVLPGQSAPPSPSAQRAVLLWSLAAFVIGSATDYVDGWLARKLNAMSAWGAMLDPIADKIAVAGVVVGLSALDPNPHIVIGGFLILFRELFVSGLREVGGAMGVKFPVSKLAKWKTTAQLFALCAEILAAAIGGAEVVLAAHALLWIAVVLTLWTGLQYGLAAAKGFSRPD